jgi:L-glutamine:2-deoxy-scyllo-inosose/3-amino-2,3-dideoxy-scyllo-inosose aminotransferase
MADLDALASLAREHDLLLLEDAAHVHGAAWRGKRAGSHGLCGAFSMQQSKLLTAGEGGAVTTDDQQLAERLEQLRADSRRYRSLPVEVGEMELEPGGLIQGNNYCLSELQAAVLIAQLKRLSEQNRRRAVNAEKLDRALAQIPGVTPQSVPKAVTERAFYHYAFRCDPEHFGGRSARELSRLLSAELGFPVENIYPPLHKSPLWLPESKRRYRLSAEHRQALDFRERNLPYCEAATSMWLTLHHRFLLADGADTQCLVDAVERVQHCSERTSVK